ncbi:DgyrCDS13641 [Dimorphilus gyrociliatus]|uniref:DgyrCDS13641 n=1 Tax=Dimorphilus gyrociliatus TaxID=2664684 RepID=A0A7I8WBB0_9ANNE|nr:DgyrCDS13641 [Dimorphilus gyrociliatus]
MLEKMRSKNGACPLPIEDSSESDESSDESEEEVILFLTNFPHYFREHDMMDIFEKYASVRPRVKITRDRFLKRIGFAMVEEHLVPRVCRKLDGLLLNKKGRERFVIKIAPKKKRRQRKRKKQSGNDEDLFEFLGYCSSETDEDETPNEGKPADKKKKPQKEWEFDENFLLDWHDEYGDTEEVTKDRKKFLENQIEYPIFRGSTIIKPTDISLGKNCLFIIYNNDEFVKICSLMPEKPIRIFSPIISELVIVMHKKQLYRGLVQEVKDNGKYAVRLIDVGKTINTSRFFEISEELAMIKPTSIECELCGIEPLRLNSDYILPYATVIRKLLKSPAVELESLFFYEGVHYIDIKFLDTGLKISKWLIDKQIVQRLPIRGYFEGRMSFAKDPHKIFIQFNSSLIKSIDRELSQEDYVESLDNTGYYTGKKVLAGRREKNKRWFRVIEKNSGLGYLLDRGTTCKISEVKNLPENKLTLSPPQAYQFEFNRTINSKEKEIIKSFIGKDVWIKVIGPRVIEEIYCFNDTDTPEVVKSCLTTNTDDIKTWNIKSQKKLFISLKEFKSFPDNGFSKCYNKKNELYLENTPVRRIDLKSIKEIDLDTKFKDEYFSDYKSVKQINLLEFSQANSNSVGKHSFKKRESYIFIDKGHFTQNNKFELCEETDYCLDIESDTYVSDNVQHISSERAIPNKTFSPSEKASIEKSPEGLRIRVPVACDEENIFLLNSSTSKCQECYIMRNYYSFYKVNEDIKSTITRMGHRTKEFLNGDLLAVKIDGIWLRAQKQENGFYCLDLCATIPKERASQIDLLPESTFKIPLLSIKVEIERLQNFQQNDVIRVRYIQIYKDRIVAKEMDSDKKIPKPDNILYNLMRGVQVGRCKNFEKKHQQIHRQHVLPDGISYGKIMSAESPSRFSLLLDEKAGEYESILKSNLYFAERGAPMIYPEKDQMAVAYYKSKWQRARVLDYGVSRVSLRLIDLGKTDERAIIDKMLYVQPEVWDKPPAMIDCELFGAFPKLGDSWTLQDKKFFENLVIGKTCKIQNLSRKDSKNSVRVFIDESDIRSQLMECQIGSWRNDIHEVDIGDPHKNIFKYSQIPILHLEKGTNFCLHILTKNPLPSLFRGRIIHLETMERIGKMSSSMTKRFEKNPKVFQVRRRLVAGEVVFSYNKNFKAFYRSVILSGPKHNIYNVMFIDNGTEEEINIKDMRCPTNDDCISSIPIPIRNLGFTYSRKETFSDAELEKFSSIVSETDGKFFVKLAFIRGDRYVIEIAEGDQVTNCEFIVQYSKNAKFLQLLDRIRKNAFKAIGPYSSK